jgi:hypothetical protein
MDHLLLPDAAQLSRVIQEAVAPAFLLGAVAGFVSILLGRTTSLVERIRHLNDITDEETRARLKTDIPLLRRRVVLLNSAIRFALASGMCTALLLVAGFASALLRLQHVYSAAVLFFLAVVLLVASLLRFFQEASIGLTEADHYR